MRTCVRAAAAAVAVLLSSHVLANAGGLQHSLSEEGIHAHPGLVAFGLDPSGEDGTGQDDRGHKSDQNQVSHEVAFSYQMLGGTWELESEGSDDVCSLKLDSQIYLSGHRAHTGINCPAGFFNVSSWVLAGDEIRLLSIGGEILGRLHPGLHGRWEGRGKDGGAIFMSRK